MGRVLNVWECLGGRYQAHAVPDGTAWWLMEAQPPLEVGVSLWYSCSRFASWDSLVLAVDSLLKGGEK